MKKINLLFYFLLLSSIFSLLFACQKRGKLVANTLVISIDPCSDQSLTQSGTLSLKALCRASGKENESIKPKWSVTGGVGTLSVSEGVDTVFTAASTAVGTGKIIATYETVSSELNITVSAPIIFANYYGLYSETYVSPTYPALKPDTSNPGDADGGALGGWGGFTLSDGTGAGEYTEGTKALKCTIGGAAGGWWLQFGSDNIPGLGGGDAQVAKNMSSFLGGNLKFDVKTSKEILVKLEWTGGNKALGLNADLGIPVDNAWHSVTVPLSSFTGIDFATIKIPAGFHTANTSFVYYIDNVRWEK